MNGKIKLHSNNRTDYDNLYNDFETSRHYLPYTFITCDVNVHWHFLCNIYTFDQDIRVCIHSVVFDLSIYDVILVFLFSPHKMIGRKVDDKSCLSFLSNYYAYSQFFKHHLGR